MLAEEVKEVGDVWKSEDEARKTTGRSHGDSNKIKVLHLQIQFRKVVLGAIHPKRTVF